MSLETGSVKGKIEEIQGLIERDEPKAMDVAAFAISEELQTMKDVWHRWNKHISYWFNSSEVTVQEKNSLKSYIERNRAHGESGCLSTEVFHRIIKTIFKKDYEEVLRIFDKVGMLEKFKDTPTLTTYLPRAQQFATSILQKRSAYKIDGGDTDILRAYVNSIETGLAVIEYACARRQFGYLEDVVAELEDGKKLVVILLHVLQQRFRNQGVVPPKFIELEKDLWIPFAKVLKQSKRFADAQIAIITTIAETSPSSYWQYSERGV